MKTERLVTDSTAVASPDRADPTIFRVDFGWALFWPIQAVFVVGEAFFDVGTPS